MESESVQKDTKIKNYTRLAFIFALLIMVGSQILGTAMPAYLGQIVFMVVGIVIALRGSCRPEKGTLLSENNKMTGMSFVVTLGAFMLAKLLSLILSAGFMTLFVAEGSEENLQGLTSIEENLFMSFLFLGIVTPIGEEIVFRGCIGAGFKKYGIWFAMIMSTILFALYHCNLFQLVSTFLPGIVLFYVAMNYSIKWSVLFHFINNGVLSVGGTALKNAFPDSFLANNLEYVLEIVLVIAAVVLMKKDGARDKVKAFLSGPENEKGAYKAAMGNVWFVLLVLAVAVVTVMMLLMLSGNIPEVPAIA